MEERSLNFGDVYTIEQFKSLKKVPSVDVRQNPKTSKGFITYGAATGMISNKLFSKIVNGEDYGTCMIARVTGVAENGEKIDTYMLYEQGQGGAPTLESF